MAAPVSSTALCNDSFFEPCSCEEKTWNSALAVAISWNIPPTPPIFSVKMWGKQEENFSAFYSDLSLKKCTIPHMFGTRGENQVVEEGGQQGGGEATALQAYAGPDICLCLHLSSSPCHPQTLT